MKQRIGILGGTFNPVHIGHLRIAIELLDRKIIDEIRFIPCKIPVHKKNPKITLKHRLDMLQLALKDLPQVTLDLREIERDTPSYMAETLTSLHDEFPKAQFYLIMGSDSLETFPHWHQPNLIMKRSHLMVIERPDTQPTDKIIAQQPFFADYQTRKLGDNFSSDNFSAQAGCIYSLELPLLKISSSYIRKQILQKRNVQYLVPHSVMDYIEIHQLYH